MEIRDRIARAGEITFDFFWSIGVWVALWVGLTGMILIATNNADRAVVYAQQSVAELWGAR